MHQKKIYASIKNPINIKFAIANCIRGTYSMHRRPAYTLHKKRGIRVLIKRKL